jgi:transposase
MCDGLERNLPEGHVVLPANCLSHGRRQFGDEINNHPELCRHILEQVGQVFANEETCKREGLVGAARLELHQRESGPVMQDLHESIEELVASKTVEPNSGLGKALSYMIKHWQKLTVFLRLPDTPLTTTSPKEP